MITPERPTPKGGELNVIRARSWAINHTPQETMAHDDMFINAGPSGIASCTFLSTIDATLQKDKQKINN